MNMRLVVLLICNLVGSVTVLRCADSDSKSAEQRSLNLNFSITSEKLVAAEMIRACAGDKINQKTNGERPLYRALRNRDQKRFELLYLAGAQIGTLELIEIYRLGRETGTAPEVIRVFESRASRWDRFKAKLSK